MLLSSTAEPSGTRPDLIDWQPWSAHIFDRAAREEKLVLLDLKAVSCHWCHVMDQKTYANEDVASVISEHFIAVKVDHDARKGSWHGGASTVNGALLFLQTAVPSAHATA